MVLALKAEERKGATKSERKGFRSNGKIPGVVYGSKMNSTPIAVDEKDILALLRSNPNAIIQLNVPGMGNQPVMINEIQRDAISRNLLHIDFHRINMNEPVLATVRLDFQGDPAGVKAGGILQVQLHEIAVRCLPDDLPNSIEVDISELEVGSNMLVSELKVSSKIEIKTDENDVLVTILAPQKDAVDDELDAVAEAGFDTTEKVEAASKA